jgi:hypothetical protein
MSRSVGQADESVADSVPHRAADIAISWLVRTVILMSILISAEFWREKHRAPVRLPARKNSPWAVSFWNLFS